MQDLSFELNIHAGYPQNSWNVAGKKSENVSKKMLGLCGGRRVTARENTPGVEKCLMFTHILVIVVVVVLARIMGVSREAVAVVMGKEVHPCYVV